MYGMYTIVHLHLITLSLAFMVLVGKYAVCGTHESKGQFFRQPLCLISVNILLEEKSILLVVDGEIWVVAVSNIFGIFIPNIWGKMNPPILTAAYFFKGVGEKPPTIVTKYIYI